MKMNKQNKSMDKSDSDYYLRLSITCLHNASMLIKSSNLIQKESGRQNSLFLHYTAFEELQKAIFCMMVHREFLHSEQIKPIFTNHEAKIILYEKIFNSTSGLTIKDNNFILEGVLLKNLDFEKIVKENKKFGKEYMKKRNDSLYVRPTNNGIHSPGINQMMEDEKRELIDQVSALRGFWELIWMNDFKGEFYHFQHYKNNSKNEKPIHTITFQGKGAVPVKRENYLPDWIDELDDEMKQELVSIKKDEKMEFYYS